MIIFTACLMALNQSDQIDTHIIIDQNCLMNIRLQRLSDNWHATKQPSAPPISKADNSEGTESEIQGLLPLRVRGKSVPFMRECPGPLEGVNRELAGVVRVCVEMGGAEGVL